MNSKLTRLLLLSLALAGGCGKVEAWRTGSTMATTRELREGTFTLGPDVEIIESYQKGSALVEKSPMIFVDAQRQFVQEEIMRMVKQEALRP